MSRSSLSWALLATWSIGTTAFIGYDRWMHFAEEQLASASEQGRREILTRVLQEAEKCRPFAVVNGEENAELVATRCLRPHEVQSQPGQPEPSPHLRPLEPGAPGLR